MATVTELWVRDAPAPAEVQRSFCDEHPALVAAREDLDWAVWDHLAATYPDDVEVMAHLVARPLDVDRLTAVLTRKGQRVAVLLGAIHHNRDKVTAELVEKIPKLTATVAGELAGVEHLDDDARYAMALRAGKLAPAEMLWRWVSPGVADTRVLDLLARVPEWWPTRPSARARRLVASLFELSHGVADEMCADTSLIADEILMTVAGSHRLTADAAAELVPRIRALTGEKGLYTQMAFVSNPRVPLTLAEDAVSHQNARVTFHHRSQRRGDRHLDVAPCDTTDVDLLKWAASRTMPSESRPSGRPWCAPDIVASPAFGEIGWYAERITPVATGAGVPPTVARRCAEMLGVDLGPRETTSRSDGDDDPRPTLLEDVDLFEVRVGGLQHEWRSKQREVLAAASARLGDDPNVWRVFVSLVDGYPGTVAEAIELATVCA